MPLFDFVPLFGQAYPRPCELKAVQKHSVSHDCWPSLLLLSCALRRGGGYFCSHWFLLVTAILLSGSYAFCTDTWSAAAQHSRRVFCSVNFKEAVYLSRCDSVEWRSMRAGGSTCRAMPPLRSPTQCSALHCTKKPPNGVGVSCSAPLV